MITSSLLNSRLLGHSDPPMSPSIGRLGPVGRCPKVPTLFVVVVDDSGSITAPGGADPISNRYAEVRAAMVAVARVCRCGRELAAVIHFDTPHGDAGPQRLTRSGVLVLSRGLRVPSLGLGTSDLLPGLRAARQIADDHPGHNVVLAVLSDFQLTDSDEGAVRSELESFPGTVLACLIGGTEGMAVAEADQTISIGFSEPPGALARAVLVGLTHHRLNSSVGIASGDNDPVRGRFHNAFRALRGQAPAPTSTPDAVVRAERRAARRPDRSVDG